METREIIHPWEKPKVGVSGFQAMRPEFWKVLTTPFREYFLTATTLGFLL